MNDFFQSACSPSREGSAKLNDHISPNQENSMKESNQISRVELGSFSLRITSQTKDIIVKILAAANERKSKAGEDVQTNSTRAVSPSAHEKSSKVAAFKERLKAAKERESQSSLAKLQKDRSTSLVETPPRPSQASRIPMTAPAKSANSSVLYTLHNKRLAHRSEIDLSNELTFMPSFDKTMQEKSQNKKLQIGFMDERRILIKAPPAPQMLQSANFQDQTERYDNEDTMQLYEEEEMVTSFNQDHDEERMDPLLDQIYDEEESMNFDLDNKVHEKNPLHDTEPSAPTTPKRKFVVKETKSSQLLRKFNEELPLKNTRSTSINRMRPVFASPNRNPLKSRQTTKSAVSAQQQLQLQNSTPNRRASQPVHERLYEIAVKKTSSEKCTMIDGNEATFQPTLATANSTAKIRSRSSVHKRPRSSVILERSVTNTPQKTGPSRREEIAQKKLEKQQEENAQLQFKPTLLTKSRYCDSQSKSPMKASSRQYDSPSKHFAQDGQECKSNHDNRFSRLYEDAVHRHHTQQAKAANMSKSAPNTPHRNFKKPFSFTTGVDHNFITERTMSDSSNSTFNSVASAIVRSPKKMLSPEKQKATTELLQACFVAIKDSQSADSACKVNTLSQFSISTGKISTRNSPMKTKKVSDANAAPHGELFKPQISKKAQAIVRPTDNDVGNRLYATGEHIKKRIDSIKDEVLRELAKEESFSPKLNPHKPNNLGGSETTLLERQKAFEKAKSEKLERLTKDVEETRRLEAEGANFTPVFESQSKSSKLLEKRQQINACGQDGSTKSDSSYHRKPVKIDYSCTFKPQLVSKQQSADTSTEYHDVYSRLYYKGVLDQNTALLQVATKLEEQLKEACPFAPSVELTSAIDKELKKRESVFARLTDHEHSNWMKECLESLKNDLDMRGCTFTPSINKKSTELANKGCNESCSGSIISNDSSLGGESVEDRLMKKHEHSQYLLKQKQKTYKELLDSEVTNKPTIIKKSIELAKALAMKSTDSVGSNSSGGSNTSVENRLMKWNQQAQNELEKKQKQRLEDLNSENPNKPTIPKKSIELAKKQITSENTSVFERLANTNLDISSCHSSTMSQAMEDYIHGNFQIENVEVCNCYEENPMTTTSNSPKRQRPLLNSSLNVSLPTFHVSKM